MKTYSEEKLLLALEVLRINIMRNIPIRFEDILNYINNEKDTNNTKT
jgi:hypothetical protein